MRRRWSWLALAGLVVAQLVTALEGPALIGWWNRSAVATPFACDEAMLVAVRQYVRLSAFGSVVGALVFVGAGLWWSGRRPSSGKAGEPRPPTV
ncbi:MAG: hypothetical protein RL199_197 [Pseudomonadota bacterium]|jgi:hypothetical protein